MIDFWVCWVFVSVWRLSLVAASGGHSSLRCAGLSLSRPLLLRSTGSRCAGSVVVAHGPSRSAACGILPDQGSNPCPLHWQADSQPLHHQGSPTITFYEGFWIGSSAISHSRNWIRSLAKMKTTWMSTNRWTDKENVIYTYNWVLFSHKKEENPAIFATWMDLGCIT